MHTLEQLRTGALAGVRRLNLACGLSTFPREIFDLADTLEILDLSGNALSSLPDELPQLHHLRILFCSDNRFTELPEVLGRCENLSMVGFKANRIRHVPTNSMPKKLRWLILTDNAIETLPDEIGACGELQKLMLAGNRLQSLPTTLADCKRLELLRIAANRLTELPAWLTELPRLAWLAYAGNPFNAALETAALTRESSNSIPWGSLKLNQTLGEGASGVIHRAKYLAANEAPREVAVKLFKGAVTSDGLPHCEMAACISAGTHPNLIPVLGKITDHPSVASGLVMALIDTTFANLAEPPSLESCTRDIYRPETRFSPLSVLRIAHGMASAAQHLHRKGILHGDLYAHNILRNDQGQALMGDFGAASFYATEDRALAEALQRLEVRAFGCLLEELIARCAVSEASGETMLALNAIKLACLSNEPERRPLFDEIESRLAALYNAPCAQ